MKTKILFIIAIVLSSSLVNSANAKNQNTKLSDIKISNSQSKDEREELHTIDLEKLYKDAENYYKLAKSWQKLKCQPKSGFICTKHECKRKDISAHIILDKKQKQFHAVKMTIAKHSLLSLNKLEVLLIFKAKVQLDH